MFDSQVLKAFQNYADGAGRRMIHVKKTKLLKSCNLIQVKSVNNHIIGGEAK